MVTQRELDLKKRYKFNTQQALRNAARDLSFDLADPKRQARFREVVGTLPFGDATVQRAVIGQVNRRRKRSRAIAQ